MKFPLKKDRVNTSIKAIKHNNYYTYFKVFTLFIRITFYWIQKYMKISFILFKKYLILLANYHISDLCQKNEI